MKLEPIEFTPTESRFRDIRYLVAGALYGLAIGTTFVLTAAIVDKLLHPDLPFGVDWSLFFRRWVVIAVGLAALGAIASLFTERLPSLFVGAIVAGLAALMGALLLSPVALGTKLLVLVFTLLPMAAMSLPVTLILRWLVDKHESAFEHSRPTLRILLLILLAIVLGIGSGFFTRLSRSGVDATRVFHQILQTAPQGAQSPVQDLPGFQSHLDTGYLLFAKRSETSTVGYDVRAEYQDGYSVMCTVVLYPGRDPFISNCQSSQNQK